VDFATQRNGRCSREKDLLFQQFLAKHYLTSSKYPRFLFEEFFDGKLTQADQPHWYLCCSCFISA
jgi:hypothetical protein